MLNSTCAPFRFLFGFRKGKEDPKKRNRKGKEKKQYTGVWKLIS